MVSVLKSNFIEGTRTPGFVKKKLENPSSNELEEEVMTITEQLCDQELAV